MSKGKIDPTLANEIEENLGSSSLWQTCETPVIVAIPRLWMSKNFANSWNRLCTNRPSRTIAQSATATLRLG